MGVLDFLGKFGKDPLTAKQTAAKQKLLAELDRLDKEVKSKKAILDAAISEGKSVEFGHFDGHRDILVWVRDLFRGSNLTNAIDLAGFFLTPFIIYNGESRNDSRRDLAERTKNMRKSLKDSSEAIAALKKLVESV